MYSIWKLVWISSKIVRIDVATLHVVDEDSCFSAFALPLIEWEKRWQMKWRTKDTYCIEPLQLVRDVLMFQKTTQLKSFHFAGFFRSCFTGRSYAHSVRLNEIYERTDRKKCLNTSTYNQFNCIHFISLSLGLSDESSSSSSVSLSTRVHSSWHVKISLLFRLPLTLSRHSKCGFRSSFFFRLLFRWHLFFALATNIWYAIECRTDDDKGQT